MTDTSKFDAPHLRESWSARETTPSADSGPVTSRLVQVFLASLAFLLLGYMFLGRGFAHVGIPPAYLGEIVLALGLITTLWVAVRLRPRIRPSPLLGLLIGFMALGLARTLPYLGQYGVDALRDAVLWGYALFALILYVVADRTVILRGMRGYGWVVPVFAAWLPISWTVFSALSTEIDPTRPGEVIPLVFFKAGDMAVHAVGATAFLVVGTAAFTTVGAFLWRSMIAVPITWAIFLTGSASRGALLTVVTGLGVVVVLGRRVRNAIPMVAGAVALTIALTIPSSFSDGTLETPSPVTPTATVESTPTTSPRVTPSPRATPTATAEPSPALGRQVTFRQWVENVSSIFLGSPDPNLEGTRAFRLAWWSTIVEYTVFGPYFWTGKGFGVNLADSDGFQPTADRSLRAPHNSHMTALARMGVPGFALWILLQGAFGIGLLRSILTHRRAGDRYLAVVGICILAYWAAMMVVTSFDPYLEGPQGGIWFWTLFGLGLVVMRLRPQSPER